MKTITTQRRYLSRCILLALSSMAATAAYAADAPANAEASSQLEEVQVTGKRAKKQENLTTITKTADTIRKEQVNNIRDLTRYDPGIAVNEQGQGASSGYSIRGVDRNRVAILVDGMAQGQVFSPGGTWQQQGEYGGAINEIEYENIKEVSIEKGANSVAGGSGAMGGAVMFTTKEADDVIKPGQNWGMDYKNSFSSKDGRRVNSLAVAGRAGGFEGLAQFTHRSGHEIKSHADTAPQTLTYFYKPQDCTRAGGPCQYQSTYAAEDVWGPTREVPNPMDYRSASWLLRGGYHFNNEHYAGLIFEDTTQKFNTQDMTHPVFPTTQSSRSSTEGDRLRNFSTLFQDNHHHKRRFGIEYRYSAAEPGKWSPDNIKVSADSQSVDMENTLSRRRCAQNLSRDCVPEADGQWSADTLTGTRENNKRLRIDIDKNIDWGFSSHRLQLAAGISKGTFRAKTNYLRRGIETDYPCVANGGSWQDQGCKRTTQTVIAESNQLEPIDSKHYFLALSDNISLGQYFSLPLGVRHDYYRYQSDNRFVGNSKYRNTSWNAGLAFAPNRHIELAYLAGSGFRVPSALELYSSAMIYPGDRNKHIKKVDEPMKPEQALNQELGLTLKGRLGNARISAFRADYRNLLGQKKADTSTATVYGNIQDAHTWGWDIRIQGDLHELHPWLPEGLSTTLAYSISKPRKTNTQLDGNQDNFINTNYMMDTLQPARLVWGLDYDAPAGNWGLGSRVIHSMPKKAEENKRLQWHPAKGETVTTAPIPALSKKWTTLDVSGWYRWGKHTTLRGGVYNVFNRKYTQWESLRQLGVNGISTSGNTTIGGNGIQRLTAPGRNFAATLEIKF
ncbi:TonB-dependent hemoglobin/transferrin/lactoferrin family receptor [Uruburuella testudinis]|uniref:TonB-dependent hemoglobin/transferrin/lactoferrin family receptor n=1 Tax=Uruburuella testudinis TaxID=1282863 RepID=A0ABY4DUJ5_9NEIS|nr:TonB-dependent hemoglobin/transferrin/lactoferrin family receptor [Uruburuella testudinis]UOO82713.1 TonB-dependent hemoglobin/transferrin/lactoferrin family receptor [Uruburuella testudinis]